MTSELLCYRLECLGWQLLSDGQQTDGRCWLLATSCGHTIVAIADNRDDAQAAACSLTMKLTRGGLIDV
jgi:hypothetical protein